MELEVNDLCAGCQFIIIPVRVARKLDYFQFSDKTTVSNPVNLTYQYYYYEIIDHHIPNLIN